MRNKNNPNSPALLSASVDGRGSSNAQRHAFPPHQSNVRLEYISRGWFKCHGASPRRRKRGISWNHQKPCQEVTIKFIVWFIWMYMHSINVLNFPGGQCGDQVDWYVPPFGRKQRKEWDGHFLDERIAPELRSRTLVTDNVIRRDPTTLNWFPPCAGVWSHVLRVSSWPRIRFWSWDFLVGELARDAFWSFFLVRNGRRKMENRRPEGCWGTTVSRKNKECNSVPMRCRSGSRLCPRC